LFFVFCSAIPKNFFGIQMHDHSIDSFKKHIY
jgi:hypothetical protein